MSEYARTKKIRNYVNVAIKINSKKCAIKRRNANKETSRYNKYVREQTWKLFGVYRMSNSGKKV
jgi:hypothetical protein